MYTYIMKKLLVLSFFSLFLFCGVTASAATAPATPVPWEETLEDGLPAVIDRFHDPDAAPAFAFAEDAELLEVLFPNIRDADCTVLRVNGQVWMVDCADGVMTERVLETLRHFGIDHIDCLINTHPHHDHLNGLSMLAEAMPVGKLMICFSPTFNEHMIAAAQVCEAHGIPVESYGHGDVLTCGNMRMEVWRDVEDTWSVNDRSAVLRVTFGERSFLILADADKKEQKRLYEAAAPDFLRSEILRYPHHGKAAMNENLYQAVRPLFVVVTNYNHMNDRENASYWLGCKHVPTAYTVSPYVRLLTDGSHWLTEQVQ